MVEQQDTRAAMDQLYALGLFIGGLDGYPGAKHDAMEIGRQAAAIRNRFQQSPDVATDADFQRIAKLWKWASVVDCVYRQGALRHFNVKHPGPLEHGPYDDDDDTEFGAR